MTIRHLILASSSIPRKQLLERLKIPFEVVSPDIDETPHVNEMPEQLVKRLAYEKANLVAEKYPEAVIIGSDQVGVVDGEILGKPETRDRAIQQLQMVSGKTMRFFIGLCLNDAATKRNHIVLETFDVTFRQLSMPMIEHYLDKEAALNCAGSFKVEGLGIALVEKLQGDDYTALIGLPLIRLSRMLKNVGVDVIE